MTEYLKLLIILPVIVFVYQLFSYTVSLKREDKQRACRSIGIIIFSAGVVCLVFRNYYAIIGGLVSIMFGLRLMAYGLERKDKSIFMDRFDEDSRVEK